MCRVWVIVVAVAGLALAVVAPAVRGEALGRAEGGRVGVDFKFRADGFLFELSNDDGDENDRPVLTVSNRRQAVVYKAAEGAVSRQGVEARFGRLGEISVDFHPTKTLGTWKLPPGCTGTVGEELEGVFSGTIRFRGERGYVEAEATDVHGEMWIAPQTHCSRRPGASRAGTPKKDGEAKEATLTVWGHGHRIGFAAVGQRAPEYPRHTFFVAARLEHREGMLIYRYAYAAARAAAFDFDFEKGTAAVRPPWPFQGGARFRRGHGGHSSWTGSLRVQLLGSDAMDLVGPGLRATLKPEIPFDE